MSILKSKEIRKMNDDELDKKAEEMKLELSKKRAQIIVGGAPENAGRIKEVKRTLARILTIKNEKKATKPKEKGPDNHQLKKEVIKNR